MLNIIRFPKKLFLFDNQNKETQYTQYIQYTRSYIRNLTNYCIQEYPHLQHSYNKDFLFFVINRQKF